MAENEPLPEGDDFLKGLLKEVDNFLNGKKASEIEPEKEKGELSPEESYTIENFIYRQIPFTPSRNPRVEVEGFYRAFPIWKETTLELLGAHKDIANREKYIAALQDLTLEKVAQLAKQKLEEAARQRGRMTPDENNEEYKKATSDAEYWRRVEEITTYAAQLGKSKD